MRITTDPPLHKAFVLPEVAVDHRMVNTVDAVYAHLGAERLMGGIVFGHHQQTAGILIDAVYDAGADRAADAGQLPGTVVKQCIDESTVRVAGGRVNHHALRLVDHQ